MAFPTILAGPSDRAIGRLRRIGARGLLALLTAAALLGEGSQWRVSLILALFLCGTLAVYGHHEGMPALRREALAGLDRTMSS